MDEVYELPSGYPSSSCTVTASHVHPTSALIVAEARRTHVCTSDGCVGIPLCFYQLFGLRVNYVVKT